MKKMGLIFDSTCGMSKKEIESKGYGFFPMIITIDKKDYRAGVDVDSVGMYKIMKNRNVKIKTSLPTGESIIQAFDKVLENYDIALYVGMSHKFSGTNNAVRVLANEKKYKGKIIVFENTEFSTPWEEFYAKEIIEMVDVYNTPEKMIKLLEKTNPYMTGFISPGDIWWFYKGGRISKIQYIIGNLAKIFPILKVSAGFIDNNLTIKIRNRNKAMMKICKLVAEEIKVIESKGLNYKLVMMDGDDKDMVLEMLTMIKTYFGIEEKDILKKHLSSEQVAHLGPGSFGLTTFVSLKELEEKE